MSTFSLDPQRAPWAWHGVAEWQESDGHQFPWRITRDLTASAHNEHFTAKVRTPAGVHARVETDATALRIRGQVGVGNNNKDTVSLDIVANAELVARLDLPTSNTLLTLDETVVLPPSISTLEVWLPHREIFGLTELTLTGCSYARAPMLARPRWLSYGSSITHCTAALGPSRTWPAIVAANLGLAPYAVGLGGQCHLDDAISRTIAENSVDFLSLCLGINIYGRGSFDERSLGSALHGFIQRALDDRPGIPITVMSPILAPLAEDEPNHVGLTLSQIRETVHRVTESIGDARLHLIDGRDILGYADTEFLSADHLHPTAAGYEFMAQRLTPALARAFGQASQSPAPEGVHRV